MRRIIMFPAWLRMYVTHKLLPKDNLYRYDSPRPFRRFCKDALPLTVQDGLLLGVCVSNLILLLILLWRVF